MAIEFKTAKPVTEPKVSFESAVPIEEAEVRKTSSLFGTFASAFGQSVINKPAVMLRGAEVYTPGKAYGLDPLLEKASITLQSLQNPEEVERIAKIAGGKLWPTGEDRKWYQIETKYIPEVLNTWAANVGDQIPLLLTTFAGRALGRIAGAPLAAAAGATAALVTGGPDPTDVATAPSVAAITSEVTAHIGGAAPLVAMEAGSFLDDANLLGIDRDIAERYARMYGIGSGVIEYAQQLWMLGRYRALSKPAQKTIIKKILSHVGGSVVEGLEEVSQQGLENKLLLKAAEEMKERNPDYEIPNLATWQGAKRAGIIATGVAAITTLPATTLSVTQQKAKQLRETRALKLYDNQQTEIDNQVKTNDTTLNPEKIAQQKTNTPTSRQRIDVQTKSRQLGYTRDQRQNLYNELTGKSWEEFNQRDAQIIVDYFDNQLNAITQSDKIGKTGLKDREQRILRGLSRTEDNFNKLIDFMISGNPLSENSNIREFQFDKYQTMAERIYKRSKKPNKPFISWARELQPARNVLYDIEMETGTNLYKNFKAAIYDSTIANQSATNLVNNVLERTGIKRRLETISVKQNEYLRWWLHDPTDEVGKSSWENMNEKTRNIGVALRNLYQSEGKYRIGLLRFKLWAEYNKKPKSVKKAQADVILKEGKEALAKGNFKDWIMKQDWVARENYYPSVREAQSLVDEIVTSLAPKDILKKFRRLPSTVPFEAYSREGKGSPIEGSVIRNTVNHFTRINTALLTMDNLVNFWKTFEGINPQQSDIDIMRDYVNNILGRGTKQKLPIRWAKKALRVFWKFYFLNPFKGAWFFTRNIMQSPAYGATQLSWKESAISLKDIALKKGATERVEDKELMWKSGISERMPVYQEWMMLEESKIRDPVRGYFANLAEEFGKVFIYSDEINRTITWLPIHRAAQRNIENLRAGKINFKQFVHRLKLDTLHPKQQIDLVNLIEEGNDREFIRQVAEYKTENIHFRYRTGLRSPSEQTLGGRILVGLMVYPRGVFNLAWQNSLKPMYEGIKTGNLGQAYRGLGNLVALYIGASLARRLLYKLTGREAYGLTQTIFGYSPLAPGPAWLIEKMNRFSWTVQEKGMSAATVNEIGSTMGDMAEFLIPFCDIAINRYEAKKDVRGVTFWNLMKKELMRKYYQRTGKRYTKTNRDDWQKIVHVLFSGGYEIPEKKKKRKIW